MGQLTFLVVDCFEDNRLIVVQSLRRANAGALVLEAETEDEAVRLATTASLAAVVVHRALGLDNGETVKALRAVNASVPILLISGGNREAVAKECGANRFHPYDRWQEISSIVRSLILT